jgi:hypothetical protein
MTKHIVNLCYLINTCLWLAVSKCRSMRIAIKLLTFIILLFPFSLMSLEAAQATLCSDGTISSSNGSGTCSWHGGISGKSSPDNLPYDSENPSLDYLFNGVVNERNGVPKPIENCSVWRGSNESLFIATLNIPSHTFYKLFIESKKNHICVNEQGAHEGGLSGEIMLSSIFWFFIASGITKWYLGMEDKKTPPN